MYLVAIKGYLERLSVIVGRKVKEDELSSLEETQKILDTEKVQLKDDKISYEMSPKEFQSKKFNAFLEKLKRMNSAKISIWLEDSRTCGIFMLENISKFNNRFNLEKVPEGLIELITEDCQDSLLVDFYPDSVEIEIKGANWVKVEY